MEPKFIDTHAHLHYSIEKIPKYKKILHSNSPNPFAEAINALRRDHFPDEFEGCVNVLCDVESLSCSVANPPWKQIANHTDFVYLAAGLHPVAAFLYTESVAADLLEIHSHPKTIAFGEIGLDYHYEMTASPDSPMRDTQKRALREQLGLYKILYPAPTSTPLVLHMRGEQAYADTLAILKEEQISRDTFIHAHCYTGTLDDAREMMEWFPNCYVGITGAVTYTTGEGKRMKNIAQHVSIDRILVETDAPYLPIKDYSPNTQNEGSTSNAAPVVEKNNGKQTGSSNNQKGDGKPIKGTSHPGQIRMISQKIADLKGMSCDEVMGLVRSNARTVYGI
ncbi:putative deoxyribonuclease tatdn2 [Nowakowskiella sp. JEL0407]|nr:putative deoxyribonuclease tatdn2 [Nowakowskiella sp. JEL0407]